MVFNLFWLFFAHAIGDSALQTAFHSRYKARYPMVLLAHSIIWTGFIGIYLILFNRGFGLGKILFLLIGHFLIDKITSDNVKLTGDFNKYNAIDQLLHLIQLLVVYYF